MSASSQAILALERPSPKLLRYYVLTALLSGPLFPIMVLPLYFKYHTMRYRFDDEGISMRWGILFRREVILNYARIQDIHLSSNVVERWLGLAKLQIQTAAGSATPEMTIEGLEEFEAIRDFLYTRMRGMKEPARPDRGPGPAVTPAAANGELAGILQLVAEELRALRTELERRRPPNA